MRGKKIIFSEWLLFLSFVFIIISFGNLSYGYEWARTFGGSAWDYCGSAKQTVDGGYIVVGSTESFSAGGSDVWLIKTDVTGNIEWDKTFSRNEDDYGNDVQQTTDGGYIIVGKTDGDYVYLIKTDNNGNHIWSKTFGYLNSDDVGNSVQQTTDGGYIIAGWSQPSREDVYLIKTDTNGNLLWSKTFGGALNEYAHSVQQTTDGGYILVGGKETSGTYGPSNAVWLIKTDANGNKEWDKTFGGNDSWDQGNSVQQTTDGGYIIAGYSGIGGAWLIKTAVNGNKEWDKTFGGSSGQSVQQTTDGGYIITGGELLIKTDVNGNKEWDKTFGGGSGQSVQQTTDRGYIIAGNSYSTSDILLFYYKPDGSTVNNLPSLPLLLLEY